MPVALPSITGTRHLQSIAITSVPSVGSDRETDKEPGKQMDFSGKREMDLKGNCVKIGVLYECFEGISVWCYQCRKPRVTGHPDRIRYRTFSSQRSSIEKIYIAQNKRD